VEFWNLLDGLRDHVGVTLWKGGLLHGSDLTHRGSLLDGQRPLGVTLRRASLYHAARHECLWGEPRAASFSRVWASTVYEVGISPCYEFGLDRL
jgi:hypothetical protein